MINTREYIEILKVSREIMPMLSPQIGADEELLFNQMLEIRGIYKMMASEFENYKVYPRHSMERFESLKEEFLELLNESIIKAKYHLNLAILNEDSWSIYKNFNEIAQFYYQDIEITKLIKL